MFVPCPDILNSCMFTGIAAIVPYHTALFLWQLFVYLTLSIVSVTKAFDFMQLKQRHKSDPALKAPLMEIYGKILQHQSTLIGSHLELFLNNVYGKTFNRNNYTI